MENPLKKKNKQKKTDKDVTLLDFWFFVTSGLHQMAPSDAWSLLRLSIPLNKPVIAMTTVVQKQF